MSLAACENLMRDAITTEAIAEKPAAVVQGAIQLHHADAELDFRQEHSQADDTGMACVKVLRNACCSGHICVSSLLLNR